jgi:hypothetical protein
MPNVESGNEQIIFLHGVYRHASIEDRTRSRDVLEHPEAIENMEELATDLGLAHADIGGNNMFHVKFTKGI